ncbi:hypothetical protein HC028_18485 [Planosporangium flavigriseum]|uniref:Uncharacterized protein n=1 Tax=Planosporangium flavigriseum TaxID=373681 RepID=A0A8J3PPW8_9ACTN|nr:hypothetical protein [Planosporangium flavigriseum]NJC66476.1 hypothetical protein [Planosporangium flavigriseum]GIG76353.1 hypothetical protein Pfl04_47570 [Planosporangium flavigriseum]
MSSFWAGMVSALIGALIGGAATAFAAWFQTRGALRVAQFQAERMLEVEHHVRLEDLRRQAVHAWLHLVDEASDVCTALRIAHRDHRPDGSGNCPDPTMPAEVESVQRAMFRAMTIHAPYMDTLLTDRCWALAEQFMFLPEIDKNANWNPRPGNCRYSERMDSLGFAVDLLLRTLQAIARGENPPEDVHGVLDDDDEASEPEPRRGSDSDARSTA